MGMYECSSCPVQERVSDSLGLEAQVIISHPVWVLGTKLGTSPRTAHLPISQTTFLALYSFLSPVYFTVLITITFIL